MAAYRSLFNCYPLRVILSIRVGTLVIQNSKFNIRLRLADKKSGGLPLSKCSANCALIILLLGNPFKMDTPEPHAQQAVVVRGGVERAWARTRAFSDHLHLGHPGRPI